MDNPHHRGDQLDLGLPGVSPEGLELWEGRSPRVLTKAHILFSLGALPPAGLHAVDSGSYENCSEVMLDEQARRHHYGS